MQIGILGPLEVREAGAPVEIRGARLRALLIRLALDPDRVVGVQALGLDDGGHGSTVAARAVSPRTSRCHAARLP